MCALCDCAVAYYSKSLSVGIKPLTLSAFMSLSTHWSKQHQSSKMPVALKGWEWESRKKKQSPSVIRYNTIWPLISADTKADSSVASLVAIPVPNHQWIPTVILSSLLLNIYNTRVFLVAPCHHLPNESITTKSSFIFDSLIFNKEKKHFIPEPP